ncbi:hypothetical protein GETHLI_19660 [Geothrix limicola]|uniref:YCII-related domain-containing protein n=1 Tax=Geothrix limicola TaxID=2927978 RepID=A0ABQ5QF50_9BACT|nr:YciI family protein [Geothrix limicola]GLH73464.1 hypothetical protein GETHLI_19660 [Geothrix limicola]
MRVKGGMGPPRFDKEVPVQYMLLDYVREEGWTALTKVEQVTWLGAYKAYLEAMAEAGVLKHSLGLHPTASATTLRTVEGDLQVLDGPYADSKEQLGGFHLIEAPDLDAAIAWAARCPTVRHGVVEVRPVMNVDLATLIQQIQGSDT